MRYSVAVSLCLLQEEASNMKHASCAGSSRECNSLPGGSEAGSYMSSFQSLGGVLIKNRVVLVVSVLC